MASLRVHFADPLARSDRLVSGLPGVNFVRRPATAEALGQGDPDAVLVATELGDGVAWEQLVGELVGSGLAASVFVLATTPGAQLEERAARAGAAAVLELGHAEAEDLHRLLHLAHAARRWADARYLLLLEGLAARLVYDYRNALAGIGSATRVVSDELPADSRGRVLCDEIRRRADAFRVHLESLVYASLIADRQAALARRGLGSTEDSHPGAGDIPQSGATGRGDESAGSPAARRLVEGGTLQQGVNPTRGGAWA